MKCKKCGLTRRAGGNGGDCPCEHCDHQWTGHETSPDGLPHSCAKCGRGYSLGPSIPPEPTLDCDNCGREKKHHDRTWVACSNRCLMQLSDFGPSPQWTTEPPTEPGWYWVRQGHNQPIVAWVRALDGKLRVKLFGNTYDSDVTERMFIAWLRIEAPEPPK